MQHQPATSMAIYDPVFADAERLALAGFLAGYRGATREAYALDLRQFVAWCGEQRLALFSVRRADIECYGRALEERGRARATVARRLCTVAGLYRYAEEEGLLAASPAVQCADPAWTTNRMPSDWTATRWALSSSPPGLGWPSSTLSFLFWPSTVCGSQKRLGPTSRRSVWSEDTAP